MLCKRLYNRFKANGRKPTKFDNIYIFLILHSSVESIVNLGKSILFSLNECMCVSRIFFLKCIIQQRHGQEKARLVALIDMYVIRFNNVCSYTLYI